MFAEWQWDGAVLTAQTDRYGCYPLFYFQRSGELCVGTSILTLLERGAPPAVDAPAIAAFLRLGFYLGEDTPFASIRVLPPNGRLRWDGRELAVSGACASVRPTRISRAGAVDGLIELFRTSIARRLPAARIVLPLSGGRDSRHILLALRACRRPPDECVTLRPYPPRNHLETDIAAAVARCAGVRHVLLEQREPRVAAEWRKNRRTHLLSDEHAHLLVLFDYLERAGATAYDGLGGDMLTGQSASVEPIMLDLMRREKFADAAARAFEGYGKRGIERALARLLPPERYRQFNRAAAVARVAEEMARHRSAANPVMSFFFWNRTRRELALAPYALARSTVYSPYLDHELFDFLMSLPPEIVADHRLHTDAIARGYPEFAALPFEEGADSPRGAAALRRAALHLAQMLLTPSAPVRRRYALPRLAAAAVTGRARHLWFLPLAVYLAQLRTERASAAGAARDGA